MTECRRRVLRLPALSVADAELLPSGQMSARMGWNYRSLETPIGRIGSAFSRFERST